VESSRAVRRRWCRGGLGCSTTTRRCRGRRTQRTMRIQDTREEECVGVDIQRRVFFVGVPQARNRPLSCRSELKSDFPTGFLARQTALRPSTGGRLWQTLHFLHPDGPPAPQTTEHCTGSEGLPARKPACLLLTLPVPTPIQLLSVHRLVCLPSSARLLPINCAASRRWYDSKSLTTA
jgi:hypothetical protein